MATIDPPTEDAAFRALNDYLDRLQRGQAPDRAQLLRDFPHLAAALECLDALDQLAPPCEPLAAGDQVTATLPDAGGPAGVSGTPLGDFGNYEILEELGRGGMGVVYKARQKDLDRPVALKMILGNHLASVDALQRFHVEACAAAHLHHPNIVPIYEASQWNGQPYFAMRYIEGPSLATVLKAGPLEPERAARLVAAVARAVHLLHQKGYVHRDLKPSNILLDADDVPYVTDFGLVKLLQSDSQHTSTGAILGTPSYMAPEQASGRTAAVGPSSDVYSLGAVLYECLTGRPPFLEESPLDTLVQVLEGEPARPRRLNRRVPADLEAVCLRCLEKTPEERYPSAAAVADDLDRYLAGEAVEPRCAGLMHRLRRWTRREPALAARLVALGVVCAIVEANYRLHPHDEWGLHLLVQGLLVVWGLASFGFQRLLTGERWRDLLPYAWATADVTLFTALMEVYPFWQGPVAVGYPVLIAAAGLWFRVAVVWYTAALVAGSYAVQCVVRHCLEPLPAPHHNLIFLVGLVVLAFVTAYQVQRVRALSRYYQHRPLP